MNSIWNEKIWKEMNDEVRKVAGTIRVAQKVFPTILLDNPINIPDDRFNLPTFSISEGLTMPFVEISARFQLTANQVAYEGSLQTGMKLAKFRAAELAQIEDQIVFQGAGVPVRLGVTVRNLAPGATGLLGLATPIPGGYVPPIAPIQVPPLLLPPPAGVTYGGHTFNAVVRGINLLNGQSQPGPYALILENSIFADAYSSIGPGATTIITAADRITPLVTGGFFGTAALPASTGLLVSLGGEPTTLYVGIEVTTGLTRKDDEENHFFRVFERVQFSARDPRALVRLDFT
jgi:uncharacterized linocin/CFP29 family protein